MATTAFKGNPVRTAGDLPATGRPAPAFNLTRADLSEATLATYAGKVKILNLVPSLDTPVCAASARRFNTEIAGLGGAVVLNVSADLPFAQKRFCESEGLRSVESLSTFRSPGFGTAYGARIEGGPLSGLLARAVLVLDRSDRVVYAQLVPEITQEPDYAAALAAAKAALT